MYRISYGLSLGLSKPFKEGVHPSVLGLENTYDMISILLAEGTGNGYKLYMSKVSHAYGISD